MNAEILDLAKLREMEKVMNLIPCESDERLANSKGISKMLGIDRNHVAKILKRAEKQGFVKRETAWNEGRLSGCGYYKVDE